MGHLARRKLHFLRSENIRYLVRPRRAQNVRGPICPLLAFNCAYGQQLEIETGGKLIMTKINAIEPQEWATFLAGFTTRNRGRRARFEIFGPNGGYKEEQQEGVFESVSIDNGIVTVTRKYKKHDQTETMTDELTNIRGVSIQFDTDHSEDMLQFTDDKNGMTTLHFESKVDGDS